MPGVAWPLTPERCVAGQGIYGGKYGEGNNTGLETEFLTAMIKGGTDGFAVKGGDAAAGPLKLMFDGPRPHGCERHQELSRLGGLSRSGLRCSWGHSPRDITVLAQRRARRWH